MKEGVNKINKKTIYNSLLGVEDLRYGEITNCVYFISNSNGLVKIGKSNDVYRRIVELKVNCPTNLKLVGYFQDENYSKYETLFHKMFSFCQVSGEWFEELPVLDYLLFTKRLLFPMDLYCKYSFGDEFKKMSVDDHRELMAKEWWNDYRQYFVKGRSD